MDSYVAEFPAILDSFYWHRQYHKYSYRGGGWGAMKRQEKAMSTLKAQKTAKWYPLVPFTAPHITQSS